MQSIYSMCLIIFVLLNNFNFQSVDTKQSNHLVFEIRQAIKFVMSDFKHLEYLPGFCIPKVNVLI